MVDRERLLRATFGRMPEALPSDEAVKRWISQVTARERFVLERRFADTPMTLQAVGEVMGLTKERVRQIQAMALRKLRHPKLSKILTGGE
jgi:RNA polymerase primary sigma factor